MTSDLWLVSADLKWAPNTFALVPTGDTARECRPAFLKRVPMALQLEDILECSVA